MKKCFLPALILLLIFTFINPIYSQSITFSGIDSKSGNTVKIDSIRIIDLTILRDTVLKGSTTFDLNSFATNIVENKINSELSAYAEREIIDGMNSQVKFKIALPAEAVLSITAFNTLSQEVASFQNYLMPGYHNFAFNPDDLPAGVYFVIVSDGKMAKSFKILNLIPGNSLSGNFSYIGSEPLPKLPKVQMVGDLYNFTGYSDGYNTTILKEQKPNGGENYEFNFVSKANNKLTKYSLIPLMYKHIKDSDGGTTRAGADMVLMFTPYDSVYLYIGSDTDAISFHGKFTVEFGKVRIIITDPGFPVDVTFNVDTTQDQISIPIQIFSEKDGSSTWKKTRPDIAASMITLFNATALSETLPPDVIEDRVKDYGDGVKDNDPNSNIKNVSVDGSDIVVEQWDGVTIWVIMYVYRFPATKYTLNVGQLATDPRTHLNIISPKINTYDPPEKTALSIAPWDTKSFPNWTKDASGNLVCDYTNMTSTFGAHDSLDRMDRLLTNYGYKCKTIKNEDASVENIIKELLPGDGRAGSPGFIYFTTHGLQNGNLQTGTFWNTVAEKNAWITSMKKKYPDLWTFESDAASGPKSFAVNAMNYGFKPGTATTKILITPIFWKWLASKGADFTKSFVHISACLTDSTPDLRNNVKARAYLAYRIAVPADFAGAVQYYVLRSLLRPTHSAEEAYYNIMRISASKQMIFKEDTIMKTKMPNLKEGPVQTWFKGYGWDGSEMVPYQQAGWFKTPKIDQGAQWYLLWAARWGQDAQKGWQGIKDCWNTCWQYGDMGGLANPGCNSKTPGRVPTSEETAYTGWLLKGEYTITPASSIKTVPRFTLYDGK